jgi:hypothetical protein
MTWTHFPLKVTTPDTARGWSGPMNRSNWSEALPAGDVSVPMRCPGVAYLVKHVCVVISASIIIYDYLWLSMIIHHYLSLSIIVHLSIHVSTMQQVQVPWQSRTNESDSLQHRIYRSVDCGQSQDSHNGIGWDRLKTTALPAGKSPAKVWLNGI